MLLISTDGTEAYPGYWLLGDVEERMFLNMFKVQRFIFNGKSKYTWILMIHWYFEDSSLYDI